MKCRSIVAFTAVGLICWLPLAVASKVTSTTTQGGTEADPTTIVTITVDPDEGESITDFHLVPTAPDSKIPGSATHGQPTGWGTPTGSGKDSTGKHWKASDTGDPLPASGATFTITVPGATTQQTFSRFEWITSDDGESTAPTENPGDPDDDGFVAKGDTVDATSGGEIPVVSIGITGPTTVAIGTSRNYRVEAALDASQTLGVTVRAARSLESGNPDRVEATDPLPNAWGIGLSTNSRTGTTTPSEGVRASTLFGDMRNFVIVDVPDAPSLVGRQFWLQPEFSDGDVTAPLQITIVAGE